MRWDLIEGLVEDYVRVGWDFIDNIAFEMDHQSASIGFFFSAIKFIWTFSIWQSIQIFHLIELYFLDRSSKYDKFLYCAKKEPDNSKFFFYIIILWKDSMMKLIERFSSGNRSFNLASFIKVHQTITRTFVNSILSYILCLPNLLTSIGGHHNAPDALTWNSRHRLWLYARANIRITSLHCSLPVESDFFHVQCHIL